MNEITIDSPLPSAFCAMVTALTALLRCPNELSLNVLALALDWFKDILEFCDNQSYSKEMKEKIRNEFGNVIFSLIITASKSTI
jgi:hypothetical protein